MFMRSRFYIIQDEFFTDRLKGNIKVDIIQE